jgi:hypothetical protein
MNMAKHVADNPTMNRTLSLTTYATTSTSTNGTVTSGSNISSLVAGQSIILKLDGGTAQGFTSGAEYFVIPVDTNNIKLATSKADAIAGTNITTTGNAGAGDIYVCEKVGGVIYVGVSGDVSCRGIGVGERQSFSVHKSVPIGFMPVMIKDIDPSLTTATDIVAWCH